MTETLQEMPREALPDPDATAAVSDFIDYTEFFPSDLFRSLTLIGKLDCTYQDSAYRIHDLTQTYGILPTIVSNERPSPQELRKQISHALDRAIRSREATFAEASRIYDVADRHCNRLASIKKKLQALPEPPSRDPTPVPVSSPQLNRARKSEAERSTRITLHVGGAPRSGAVGPHLKRTRKITVPGEVLPPPNPDSPPPSTVSDYESDAIASPVEGRSTSIDGTSQQARGAKPGRVKIPKLPKQSIKLSTPRPPRPHGVMGTNVHSAIAGISTSNALAKLDPPPVDAKPGSKHRPWNRLTEYEMAKLRKRMKKNAIWTPSDTMVRRELADLGRGKENYDKAKVLAEVRGEPFLDEEPMDPTRTPGPGEISFDTTSTNEMRNRGMKLNEAKKLKKETLAKQAALAALEADENGLGLTAEPEKAPQAKLAPKPTDNVSSGDALILKETSVGPERSQMKRKRDSPPSDVNVKLDGGITAATPSNVSTHAAKRLKPNVVPIAPQPSSTAPSSTTTTQIPLAPPAPSPKKTTITLPNLDTDPKKEAQPAAIHIRPRRDSTVRPRTPSAMQPSDTRTPTSATRPPSRANKAQSAEPTGAPGRRNLRRPSNASLPSTTPASNSMNTSSEKQDPPSASAGRRRKRPTPGPVTAGGDGSTKVSSTKRKSKPRGKKQKANEAEKSRGAAGDQKKDEKTAVEEDVIEEAGEGDEPIDPDEPTYCICEQVSFGEMVACDNPNCEIEWFHFECVGLTEAPNGRRWYCPHCEEKYGIRGKGKSIDLDAAKKK